jgi:hypothetical protein
MREKILLSNRLIGFFFFGYIAFPSLLFFTNPLVAANPVYYKTISKAPLELFINTTNDIFLLQKGMLERYTTDGKLLQTYGSIYINERTQIISINGFKTILFSPDFGKIIQLDNRLREIDIIDALSLGTYILTCVGASYDNNFLWVWDASTQRLIKMDKDQKPVFTSNTLSLLVGKTINPRQIIESGILLYVADYKNGLLVFDNQGNYIKQIPITDTKNLKVIEGVVYYLKDDCIFSYDPLTFTETRYTQTPGLKNIQIGKTIICGINKEGYVEIWKF